MSFIARLLGLDTPQPGRTVTVEQGLLDTMSLRLEEATNKLADLRREDQGWQTLTGTGADLFTQSQLVEVANEVRAFSILNPLMKRGKEIRSGYVFGDGVTIEARDQGTETGHQNITTVIDDLIDDERNREAVFGAQARTFIENDLFDDGNVFIGHWVNPMTGAIQARQIMFDQITRIYKKPGDPLVPWFYLREWTEQQPGESTPVRKAAWYPALHHQPHTRYKNLEGKPILWPGQTIPGYGSGAAIYHLKVNPAGRERTWGVGDGYPALPWAKGYTGFLDDWAKLMRTLSKIALHLQDNGNRAQLARTALQTAQGAAGGISYGTPQVQVPNTSSARFDANSGRPLASMVAAALGITVTILTADPGQEGARAIAETLDRPMRLEMSKRREIHAEYYRAVCQYAIEKAVQAPQGPLRGRIVQQDDRQVVVFADHTDPSVEISFPPLEELDMTEFVEAVATADTTGKLPPLETLKLLLKAFGYEDVASLVEKHSDDDGNWVDPQLAADDAAGDRALQLLRRGGDPSDII